jgi:hypothetical protein
MTTTTKEEQAELRQVAQEAYQRLRVNPIARARAEQDLRKVLDRKRRRQVAK